MLPDHLQALSLQLETADPHAILTWAVAHFADRLAVVTSFQPTGIATLHILSEIAPQTPVITLDTGLLFPETYALTDQLERLLHLNLIRVRPAQTVDEQNAVYGEALWEHDPNHCCYLRKVVPLDQALRPYDAWIAGLRRDQSERRAQVPVIGWDAKHQKLKLNPFATWTEVQVWDYLDTHDLPYNPLHDRGYPSIGCLTCTRAVGSGEDRRAGRWANRDKTECGIHVGNL
ncbi:MAG: phosphoadenylyl-sulfate reductase [Anaerolineae bacterium]|jgi:phosphoadenosine phosphosulfate reductase|nr:phosphoadenylyl-sulfate reductase [Anaerolineae bacterium]